MTGRPTLRDVAIAAGVSYATADRVVNGRGNVAAKSELRVREAIERLDYTRDVHAANLSKGRIYRFRFIIPDGGNSFFDTLAGHVEAQRPLRRPDRIDLHVVKVRTFDSPSLVAALTAARLDKVDGVAVVAAETPAVRAAMADLRQAGIVALTLVSDVGTAWRDGYVGIDNPAAGRTVGRLMRLAHRDRAAVILPLIGSGDAADHRHRLEGFAEVLRGSPALHLLDAVETGDDPSQVERAVTDALGRTPVPSGIYNAGAGNEGLIAAMSRVTGPRPVVVLHELSPHARRGLKDDLVDAVVDQRPDMEVAETLRLLRSLCDGTAGPPAHITPAIHVKDNLPRPDGEDAAPTGPI